MLALTCITSVHGFLSDIVLVCDLSWMHLTRNVQKAVLRYSLVSVCYRNEVRCEAMQGQMLQNQLFHSIL